MIYFPLSVPKDKINKKRKAWELFGYYRYEALDCPFLSNKQIAHAKCYIKYPSTR